MKKQSQLFYFFGINNVTSFKEKLHDKISPDITSTLELQDVSTQPQVCLNLAFSHSGLVTLGFNTNLGDSPFGAGQTADAVNLGDGGTSNWKPPFIGTKIHGVFLIATDTLALQSAQVTFIQGIFGTDITELYTLQGNIRPPPFAGHESK